MRTGDSEVTTIADVAEALLTLEAEHDLLEIRVGGVPMWERIRQPVLYRVLGSLDVTGQAHGDDTSKVGKLFRLLRSLVVQSPLFADPTDLLVWGHERRKQLDDGRWIDVYCDPLLETLPEPVTYLEQSHEGRHLEPTVTDDVRHLDFVQQAPNLALQFLDDEHLLSEADREALRDVESLLETEFGTSVDLVGFAGVRLLRRRIQLPLYEAILRRVDPSLAVLVVSYGRETFVEACRRQGIPTIELQHGVVSRYHLGYSYPGERTKQWFPDYFFSFGDFWGETVEFPLPSDRIYSVGYPYLERRVASAGATPSADRIVFISQGRIGAQLSRFAQTVAERHPELDVVYKLHPGEYSRWEAEYPWLADAPLEVVSDEPLYELFATSSAQVGVFSTALYEGLCFDLDTYIVDLPGVSYVEHLIDSDAARLVSSADELGEALAGPRTRDVDTDRFFRPNALEHIRDALESVRRRESAE